MMSIGSGDNITRLTPKETQLLSILMEGVVRKEVVVEQIWGSKGLVVSDGSYHQLIRTLRVKLTEQGLGKNSIKTLPRIGLEFVGTIESAAELTTVETTQYPTTSARISPGRVITDFSVKNSIDRRVLVCVIILMALLIFIIFLFW
ncbi:winged helix-turn-helix domain-containing protein [Burkholderia mayonis]|uniref:winged helix-turn-helix domain-containing protein n=1 Tax=Burkholderia mayonis TaxID=1385591 RepID=UPI00131F26D6|nr:helix-turn-helix domain-containing protein [Burkholderia mayonis]